MFQERHEKLSMAGCLRGNQNELTRSYIFRRQCNQIDIINTVLQRHIIFLSQNFSQAIIIFSFVIFFINYISIFW